MQTIHDDTFFPGFMGRQYARHQDWKEATSSMTDKDFKSELELFAGLVEAKKARSILVDVAHFRHNQGPGMQEWRLKNISLRYSAAGVRRFAFLLPKEAPVPPMMNQLRQARTF